MPAKIVRLDTEEDRQRAKSGAYFQINEVPTLLVIYSDSNIELFTGTRKILTWMSNIVNSSKKSQPKNPLLLANTLDREGDSHPNSFDEEPQLISRPAKSLKSGKKKK
jgi:hypothetical protein